MQPIVLDLSPFVELTDDQFYQFCQNHRDLSFERSAQGELIILPLLGGLDSIRSASLTASLVEWNRKVRSGIVFSSSTGFKLPNGAVRSPNVAWVAMDRWQQLTPEQRERFPPMCPDFLVELRSENISLKPLQAKMQEYINNGLRLGWLINSKNHQIEIYRANQAKEVVIQSDALSCADILPGFELTLSTVWG